MKTKFNFFIALIFISITTTLLYSCEADADIINRDELRGDRGPEGPTGPEGQQGPQGPEGQQGAPGADGNANVIVSEWKNFSGAKDSVFDNTAMRVITVEAPELTEDRLENSAILVYLNYGAGAFPLPYTSNAALRISTISFFPEKGKIRPFRFVYDGGPLISISSMVKFKYVIIPHGAVAPKTTNSNTKEQLYKLNSKNYTLEQLKAMSYEEISVLLNIS